MANRRVVVTGMGAVTPIGCDLASFWAGLCAGKNGIDFITRFDASELKAKLAAEVKDRGEYEASVKLYKGIKGTFKFNVVAE